MLRKVFRQRASLFYQPSSCATMSTTSAFIVPIDVKAPSGAVPNVDIAKTWATVPHGEKVPDVGTTRIFYDTPSTKITAISSLGDKFSSKKTDAKREIVRKSVGSAVKSLKALDGLKEVVIDASADPHAAGEILEGHANQFLTFSFQPSLRTLLCTSST